MASGRPATRFEGALGEGRRREGEGSAKGTARRRLEWNAERAVWAGSAISFPSAISGRPETTAGRRVGQGAPGPTVPVGSTPLRPAEGVHMGRDGLGLSGDHRRERLLQLREVEDSTPVAADRGPCCRHRHRLRRGRRLHPPPAVLPARVEGLIPHTAPTYRRLSARLAQGRREERFLDLIDPLREVHVPPGWPDAGTFLREAPDWFALDRTAGQATVVYVPSEKAILRAQLKGWLGRPPCSSSADSAARATPRWCASVRPATKDRPCCSTSATSTHRAPTSNGTG